MKIAAEHTPIADAHPRVGRGMKRAAHREIAIYSVVQVAASLAPWALGVAGDIYLAIASVSGAVFLAAVAIGLARGAGARWAKQLFLLSIVYLPLVFAALVFDGAR